MNLEKLILGAVLATGCTQVEVIRKPYVKGERAKPVARIKEIPIRAGYSEFRMEDSPFSIYQATLFQTGNPLITEEQELKEIAKQRLTALKNKTLSNYLKENIKNLGYQINEDNFYKNNIWITNNPSDVNNLTDILNKCLNKTSTSKIDFVLNLCDIYSDKELYLDAIESKGIILGENYIITSADAIYPKIISQELKKAAQDTKELTLKIIRLRDMKNQGSASINKGKVLAINPVLNLALIEVTNKDFLSGSIVSIANEKAIDEVRLFSNNDYHLKNKANQIKLNAEESEMKLARSMNQLLLSTNTLNDMQGSPLLNEDGLVGILAGMTKEDENKKNSQVIRGSTVRKFLEDYLTSLKETKEPISLITKLESKPIEYTPVTTTEPETTTPPKIKTTSKTPITESTTPIENKETPTNPLDWLLYVSPIILAGIILRPFYKGSEPKPRPDLTNIDARLNELDTWLAPYRNRVKESPEAHIISAEIIIPDTNVDIHDIPTKIINRDPQVTIDNFGEIGMKELNVYEEVTKFADKISEGMLELPQTFKDWINHKKLPEDKKTLLTTLKTSKTFQKGRVLEAQKLLNESNRFKEENRIFLKERKATIERLNEERKERLINLLYLKRI